MIHWWNILPHCPLALICRFSVSFHPYTDPGRNRIRWKRSCGTWSGMCSIVFSHELSECLLLELFCFNHSSDSSVDQMNTAETSSRARKMTQLPCLWFSTHAVSINMSLTSASRKRKEVYLFQTQSNNFWTLVSTAILYKEINFTYSGQPLKKCRQMHPRLACYRVFAGLWTSDSQQYCYNKPMWTEKWHHHTQNLYYIQFLLSVFSPVILDSFSSISRKRSVPVF